MATRAGAATDRGGSINSTNSRPNASLLMQLRSDRFAAMMRIALSVLCLVESFASPLRAQLRFPYAPEKTLAAQPVQPDRQVNDVTVQSPVIDLSPTRDVSRTVYAGFWRTDNGFVSNIQIKNKLVSRTVSISPVLLFCRWNGGQLIDDPIGSLRHCNYQRE